MQEAFNEQEQILTNAERYHGNRYNLFIYDYSDCGVYELYDQIVSIKSRFICRIVDFFNQKYHLCLSSANEFDRYSYSRQNNENINNISLKDVLNKYIFDQMEGLTFSDCAIKQAIEQNDIVCQKWYMWRGIWNYYVKGKTIKFSFSISKQKPLLYYYDNNEKEICTELKHNKIESITEFKNGSVSVKFISAEFALEFAKKYLGYIEMTDEEREKLKQQS